MVGVEQDASNNWAWADRARGEQRKGGRARMHVLVDGASYARFDTNPGLVRGCSWLVSLEMLRHRWIWQDPIRLVPKMVGEKGFRGERNERREREKDI